MHPYLKTFVVSIGMMTDAYEIFLMNICYAIIKTVYGETSYSSTLSCAVLIGMAVGQLLFGFLGDVIGKKTMFIITLMILIIFSILQAFAFELIAGQGPYIVLAVIRLILGLGIGGEYPLSSSIAAEDAQPSNRGRKMVFIFSMQGIGNILAPTMVIILLWCFQDLDIVWRVALALGSVPCILTLYFRVRMDLPAPKGTAKTTKQTIKRLVRRYWFYLIGTAGCWFFFDIAFYGNSMFNSTVLQIIGIGADEGASDHQAMMSTAVGNLVLSLMAFPGFIVSFFIVDRVGRKPLQLLGFVGTTVCFITMAVFQSFILESAPILFVLVYGLSFFFENMGPNTTTYITSAETYDPRIRGTFNGLSAASGKTGAMIGTAVFDPFASAFGTGATFGTCAAIMMVGFALTFIVPENKGADIDIHDELDESLQETHALSGSYSQPQDA